MIFGQDRRELRRMYVEAWRKARAGEPLGDLDAQLAAVIEEHPEYHRLLTDDAIDADFTPQDGTTNPFLHMGLHLALRDQLQTDRPAGIRDLYKRIARQARQPHEAEHRMIECLAETLWKAQRRGSAPDEAEYLERLRQLVA